MLLKTLARLLKPSEGTVVLDSKAIHTLSSTQVAQQLAILPHGPSAPQGLTVGELVEQGRYPHVGALRMLRKQDHDAIREALALTNMTSFAHRPLNSLSGGNVSACGLPWRWPRRRPYCCSMSRPRSSILVTNSKYWN